MKVTAMVVTYNREHFMPAIYHVFNSQTHPNKELLVLDDSDKPSAFFQKLDDKRVRYTHLSKRLSIGEKRNRLVREAQGEWICHFDDDDYYAPNYMERMLGLAGDHVFVKLTGWYNYSVSPRILTFLDTREQKCLRFKQTGAGLYRLNARRFNSGEFNRNWVLGYGFSYFYRRQTGLNYPFQPINHGEDFTMADAFERSGGRIFLVRDDEGLVLHQLHASNTSWVAPQYRIPEQYLTQLFPKYNHYAKKIQQPKSASKSKKGTLGQVFSHDLGAVTGGLGLLRDILR